MANYRQIHVNIWKDEWFLELEPAEKLLFIYLFSNESASLSGIYKVALKVICFETGLSKEFVSKTLAKFEKDGKAYYRDGLLWVKKMRHYNPGGIKVMTRILTDVGHIPDCELKRMYLRYYSEGPNSPPPPDDTKTPPTDTSQSLEDTPSIDYPYPIDTEPMKLNEMKLNEEIGANAPAETSETFPIGISKHEKDNRRAELQVHFLKKTGVPVPKTKPASRLRETQKLWWGPLWEILEMAEWDVGCASKIVDDSLKKLEGMTISDPNSIIKTARAIFGENHRENGSGKRYSEIY